MWLKLIGLTFVLITSAAVYAQEVASVPPDAIAAYPEPAVTPLYPQDNQLYDRIYRRVTGTTRLFDAPGGNLVDELGAGFNFVTLMSEPQGEWAQITPDRWMQVSELSTQVNISRFAGVLLPDEPLPYTMAWTLRHLRASSTPGGDEDPNNPFMYRYTRVNLYTYVEVDGYRWYQIGQDKWVHQFDVAKYIPVERPEGVNTEKWVSVDLYEQTLVAYEGTKPVFTTLISSGLQQWATREGLFNVYFRRERTLMAGSYGQPDFYYLEEVPWTMYFDGDIGLHGTYWHDGFGYRRSHGCVNLSITDAKWLYQWSSDVRDFSDPESVDLAVYVYSSGEYK
jgi:lipoprotein-anchoring transpeptidase ErfK/SrfK